jgi:glycosyltransferase involved in cell wall biosynthesis
MAGVTVVIPLYNKGPYILRALNSIARQSYRDFAAIVVNDGSTDNSRELAESFRDPRFRVIHQKNAGPGAARNRGVAEATSPLIAFLDADDEWFPDHLETAVRFLADNPDVACLTQSYLNGPGMNPSKPMWHSRGIRDGLQKLEDYTPLSLHYSIAFMFSQATVARTELFRKWGGFYEDHWTYGEDGYLWLKFLLNERVVFSWRETLAIYFDASDLNLSMRKDQVRQLEPFLVDPDFTLEACPPRHRQLFRDLCTLRAFKAACAWGYHGQWQRAAQLRRQFRQPGDYRIPWYFSAWVCSTPVGAGLGAAWRALNTLRGRPTVQGAGAVSRATKPNRAAANS